MRPLTESETKVVFDKLATFCGQSLKQLIAPEADGDRYVFRSMADQTWDLDGSKHGLTRFSF